MIILFQKDFAETRNDEIKKLISSCHTGTKELIKAIELYWYDQNDVDHWIEKATGSIMSVTNNKIYVCPKEYFICCFRDDEISKMIGSNFFNQLRKSFPSPESFIQSVKMEIITEKGGKYQWLKNLNDFSFSDMDYVNIFRYISLCISGDINPSDFKSNRDFMQIDINIPKIRRVDIDKQKLKFLLRECVDFIRVYSK